MQSALDRRAWAGVALIVIATSLAYSPCLSGGFILDDNVLVTENPLISAADGLYRIWLTTEPIDYWPVSNSSLWIEWRLWGMSPTGYHATNVLLHIGTALLLWAVLRRLSIPGAFFAALLFALHPVNAESVAWITQRKNVLALLFSLVSVLLYLKAADHWPPGRLPSREAAHWYWLSLLAFALAMLSKGSVAVLPLVLVGISWWMNRLTWRALMRTVPFFVVSVVLVLVNVTFQSRFVSDIRPAGSVERLLGAGAVIWFYLYKALLPLNLSFVYSPWHIDAHELRWWLSLSAALIVTAVLWWFRQTWSRPMLFAWGYFCVALVPVMGFTDVGFMAHALVADHYQHLAIIGVLALVAAGWDTAHQHARGQVRWLWNTAAAAVGAALAFLTWQQSHLYTDALTLFRATVEASPDSSFARNNLGNALLNAHRTQEAIVEFDRALRLKPDFAEVHFNLGRTLIEEGNVEDAVGHYQQAVRFKPQYAEYHHYLGTALAQAHRLPEAAEQFQEALRLKPEYPDAHNNLGGVLFEMGRLQEAIEQYEHSLQLKPDFPEAHSSLARALLQAGRRDEATQHFEQAVRLRPDSPDARNDLGVALAESGQLEEAISQLQRALQLRPDYDRAQSNLDEVRVMMEQRAQRPQ